jgi:pyruvate dehydrogenase E2 component (dihydrolipoamide acetyltransferase)
MADLLIPDIGENVTGGDVVRILVNKGDTIKKDQAVLELETDKATIEVPSDQEGTVTEIKVKQGEKVKIGQVILTLDSGSVKTEDESPKTQDKPKAESPEPKAESPEPRAQSREPKEAQADTKPEPDKVVDIASRSKAAPKAESRESRAAADSSAKADATEPSAGGAIGAAPSVRRMARELGVDLGRVQGSGPGGRIGADDVQSFVKSAMEGGAVGGGRLSQAAPLPDFSKWGEVERKPMSNIRRKTSEHLSSAWNTIPHVTQHDKADITAFDALRKTHGPAVEKAGGKLTITAVLLKIAAAAIRKYPQFASSADGDTIVYKHYTHIGVAVDTEYGLLVPVIRDVDRKTITELSAELAQLSEKARSKKLGLDEMSGGVFTITNLGGIGGTSFTPIVNYPEVAILGVSRAVMEPVWDGEDFSARMMMPLSLSYDHRVIDGADAARFLRFVCDAVENPLLISL